MTNTCKCRDAVECINCQFVLDDYVYIYVNYDSISIDFGTFNFT